MNKDTDGSVSDSLHRYVL